MFEIGNFVDIVINIIGGVEDEAAVHAACDTMMNLCGNPGQETLIGEHIEDFAEWALDVLEGETEEGTNAEDFAAMVTEWYGGDFDKFDGTDIIWYQGWEIIADQSGWHDVADEDPSTGVGQQFGGW